MVVIDRWECWSLREGPASGAWLLVYGRRKTGKTFLLRRCVDSAVYVTIGRSGLCLVEEGDEGPRIASLEEGLKAALRAVESGYAAVIDEFQRLPEEYWDLLAVSRARGKGRLILCGSSLGVASKVFDRRSPLLGFFAPLKVDLASPSDTLVSLSTALSPSEAAKWAIVARDPWLLGLLEPRGDVVEAIAESAHLLVASASGLVGEVFREEERKLTQLYDAILRLLALGYWSSAALAQKLHEARLLPRPEASLVTGMLAQLAAMGLVERVRMWKTPGARIYYRHRSSLLSLLMALEERGFEAGLRPSCEVVSSTLGVEAQFFVGELLAEATGLKRAYAITGTWDVDVVLLKGERAVAGYEVKLGPFSGSEASKAVERIRSLGIPRAGLVSLTEEPPPVADEGYGPSDLVELARKTTERLRRARRSYSRAPP
uniref:ATP-binding protein n=1 Tax=Thermofilum pendens TaxID=2269 RepID=A0A7J3X5F9_THEPE